MPTSSEETVEIRGKRAGGASGSELVAAVIDASARASGCYLGLVTELGEVVHASGPRPDGQLATTPLEAADGSQLVLEGKLEAEQLGAVARLVRQAIATQLELVEARTDLGRSRAELSLLFEFSQSVCRVSTVEQVVERFLIDVVNVLDAEEGTLLGVDEERGELRIVCHHGSSPETIANFSLALGTGIAGAVARDGRPRLVNDTSRDPHYVAGNNPIRNVICVPIKLGGAVVGVVSVNDRRNGEPFEPSHLRLLSSLAQLGEIGLENARLYEQVRGLLFEAVDGLVTMMEARAPHTVGHSRRVARLAYTLGRQLKMARQELERLYLAALIHDLGATPPQPKHPTAPWSCLLEADSHDTDELDELDPASLLRARGRLAEFLPGLDDHDRRFDSADHHDGPGGHGISLQGRIIAVAHAFDSATHSPQWQRAATPAQALEMIREEAGARFDPVVAARFDEVYDLLRLEAWVPPAEDDVPWKSSKLQPATDMNPFGEEDEE